MPNSLQKPLTNQQRAKRLIALVLCGILGMLLGLLQADPFAHSRILADEIARRTALTIGIRWTIIGLIAGIIMARILQSARVVEVVIAITLIVLLWGMCLASTQVIVH